MKAPAPTSQDAGGSETETQSPSCPNSAANLLSNCQPDTESAVHFLRLFHPDKRWSVTAIDPETRAIETKTFQDDSLLRNWIERFNGNRNLYFAVNPTLRDLSKKAELTDVAELRYLHVDIDPRAGEDLSSERERCLHLLTDKLPNGIPVPTAVVFSGGGFQAFWKLVTPMVIGGDLALAEDAKRYNQELESCFGGDHCHNIDRIMRLPGGINLPDARKRTKGREPALAKLIYFDPTRVYELSEFRQAPTIQLEAPVTSSAIREYAAAESLTDVSELEKWNVEDRVKVIIVQGRHPNEPKRNDNTRSAWLFDVVCHLVRQGVPKAVILSVVTDRRFQISESVLELGRKADSYARRQIENAERKVSLDQADFQIAGDPPRPVSSQQNVRIALHRLGVSVSYDRFADRSLIDGLPEFGPQLDDAAIVRLWLLIDQRFGFRPPKLFFFDVVSDAARQASFHPVRDYLDSLRWDGIPRLDRWLSIYGGVEDNAYTRAVGALLLLAAVRRVRQPGCKFDEMVVLESSEGTDKSTALRLLAIRDDWFADDLPLGADSKVVIERLRGKWIVEAAELKGMYKQDVESLKAFLSRQSDSARLAYSRNPVDVPRQSIFFGTTNHARYLRSGTGNRRFWPVQVANFDLDAIRRDRDQLWAEAAAREAEGASIRLDRELWAWAANEQDSRKIEDPFVSTLSYALGEKEGKLRTEDAWSIIGLSAGHRTQEHNARLGEAMKELGWRRKRLHFGKGKPEYAYVKGDLVNPRRIIVRESQGGKITADYEGVQPHREPF